VRSADVCDLVGISYRQLDYLTRCGVVHGQNRGSGCRRQWDREDVLRLALARHVAGYTPGPVSSFPELASLALDAPTPPARGYAVLSTEPTRLTWAASWADVRRHVEEEGHATVVAYDLELFCPELTTGRP
jgi:hypothetical protein